MAWLKRKDTEPETPLHQLSEEDFLTLSRISATMDALPLGVVVMSSDGSNMWSNRAADSLFTPQSDDHILFVESRLPGVIQHPTTTSFSVILRLLALIEPLSKSSSLT